MFKKRKNKNNTLSPCFIQAHKIAEKAVIKHDRKNGHHLIRSLAILILSSVLILGSTLFAYGQTLKEKIYPGVTVAGVPIGGLTLNEAADKLTHIVEHYEARDIKFYVRGTVLQPTFSELGYNADIAESLVAAYQVGRENQFTEQFGMPALGRQINIALVYEFDPAKFQDYLYNIENWFNTPAQGPGLAINEGEVVYTPAENGVKVVLNDFSGSLVTSLSNLDSIGIELATANTYSILTEDDLTKAREQMQHMTAESANLTYADLIYELNTDQLKQWVVYSYNSEAVVDSPEQGIEIGLDQSKFSDYLTQINNDIGIAPKHIIGYEAEVTGEYAYTNFRGRQVDAIITADRLFTALTGEAPKTAEIAVIATDPDIELQTARVPRTDGKVISVNLTQQVLFAHEDGELKFWTHVSTGKHGSTPAGEWRVNTKTPIQKMSGPGYYLPGVKWVMPYNGDYTLHTAYWHTNFGYPMSHGCTNMSEADAKWLFDWANVGTPVVIYNE
ncbi:MAG: L,D-transpeptidase family protein [Patescibacteria group bacterium]